MTAARGISFFCTLLCLSSLSAAEVTDQPFPKEYDFRYTAFEDLVDDPTTFQIYTHPDIVGPVQATVDHTHNQLIVGGREQLWRFSLSDLSLMENVEWTSTDRESCVLRGQHKSDCYNFIKILLVHQDEVLVCGTNAFNPWCTWRAADNLTDVSETIANAKGFCPFSPNHNSTGIITSQRDYISATSVDSAERNPVIYRIYTNNKEKVRTQQNSKWLNEPDFVSAYEVDDFIYFFFREVATEYINCGKRIYARVARVCKSDKGGDMLFKDNWTTYLKARLNCSIPGEYPFYFDELQSTYLLQSNNETLLYGVFTTPDNALPGSAVCVFNMSSFTHTFSGPFKYQENARYAWERHTNKDPLQKCPDSSTMKRSFQLTEMVEDQNKYQMMDTAVQPKLPSPVLLGPSERWSHVVADTVVGKMGTYNVIFVGTTSGVIRKMLNLQPVEKEPCLIEEIKVTPNGDFKPIKQLRISKEHNALYVFTLNNVMRIPLHRCSRFTSEDLCLNAMDPYCGWDSGKNRCSPAPNGDPSLSFWKQDVSSCPVHKHPVDGKWSSWSPWTSCNQAGNSPSSGNCLCRLRSCDDPPALYGGLACEGSAVEVANCTIHGHWSEWTSWSKCSTTCGNGQQTRSRSCTNPPPMNGGEDCKPLSRDEEFKASVRPFCVGNPACPEPPVDGNWSVWTPWSNCTANCNGGIQTRRRSCSNPLPQRGGIPCTGNKNEWRMCNSYTCKDEQKLTGWTPWSNINQTANGHWIQRYRFACTASVPDPNLIKTSHVKTHTRFCTNENNTCYKPDKLEFNSSVDGDWSTWSQWSSCSADCGTGKQWRIRSCDNPQPIGFGQDCQGSSFEFRTCNEKECIATWGPWSVYSACSTTCGSGARIRFRSCDIPQVGTNSSLDFACVGISEESEPCFGPVCNDTGLWDSWSTWSECSSDTVKFRHRTCLENSPNACGGQNVEAQSCFYFGAVLRQTSMGYRREYTLIHLTVVGCAAFFMGVVICVGIYICFHNWKSIRSYDVQKPANGNVYDKPRFGSFASQLSLDFLTVNNKVYDSCTLSSRSTAVVKDNTFRKDKYKNFPENMYATIRTNYSLRTEV
uniref:Semaphorin-2A n=1 Tax=Crassostrea virginica TaxID=6565 RepID=A0A8B8E3W0_CRAVI|nr:semaphorin-5B-like [Crassostrea virginica]XP_022335250.1 semaphorin-5B-like [Crassostrea virginica]XP_022335258.1 semaphorin-5B-like [Crassostrea virginica]XP_022335266.1 semaphorin-5B-like [Crassostrea virginica]